MKSEVLTLTMRIDGNDAQQEFNKLQNEIWKTRKQMQELEKAKTFDEAAAQKNLAVYKQQQTELKKLKEETGSLTKEQQKQLTIANRQVTTIQNKITKSVELRKEYNRLGQELIANEQKLNNQRKQLDLTKLSIKELKKYAKDLKFEMDAVGGDTNRLKLLRDEFEKVSGQIRKTSQGVSDTRDRFNQFSERMNRYQTMIMSLAAVFYTLYNSISKAVDRLKTLSDTVGEVQKATDLSATGVLKMKGAFDKLDTRTTTDKLLEIAKVAGQLGIRGYDSIKKFSEGANLFITALTGDLKGNADEIVKTMGVTIRAFRLDKELGWDVALQRLGSVINELAKKGANADNVIEWMNRLAGVGVQAGISADKIAAIGATLDRLGINPEAGASAIQKFLLMLGKNAEDFAKIMGVSTSEYKKMLNEDANNVMIRVLESAKKGGSGLMDLMQRMDALDVNEVRMTTTIGTLINNTDSFREVLAVTSDEMKKGTSLMNEYNIMNETFAGKMERADKKIQAAKDSLFSGLGPAILFVKKSFATLVDNIGSVSLVLGTLSIFMIRAKASIIPVDSMIGKLRTNLKAMAKELLANPWAVLVTAVVAFGAAARSAFMEFNKLFILRGKMRDLDEDANKEIKVQTALLNQHYEQLQTTTKGSKERKDLLDKMRSDYPELIKYMNLENASNLEIAKSQEEANRQLENNIRLKINEQKIEAAIESMVDVEEKFKKITGKILNADNLDVLKNTDYSKWGLLGDVLGTFLFGAAPGATEKKLLDEWLGIQQTMKEIQDERNRLMLGGGTLGTITTTTTTNTENGGGGGGGGTGTEEGFVQPVLNAGKFNKGIKDAILKSEKKGNIDLMAEMHSFEQQKRNHYTEEIRMKEEYERKAKEHDKVMMEWEELLFEDYQRNYERKVEKYNLIQQNLQAIGDLASSLSSISMTRLDVEEARIKKKYENELKLAGDNSAKKKQIQDKETKDLEKIEKQRKDINKKYALISMLASIGQIGVETRLAIMKMWATEGPLPVKIAGAIAVGIAGAANTAKAVNEYNRVKQLDKGLYPVVGEDDNKLYQAQFTKRANTGMIYKPTLVGERPEAVIDYRTFYSPKRDAYGWTVRDYYSKIVAMRAPQAAAGIYPTAMNNEQGIMNNEMVISLLNELVANSRNPVRAYVSWTELKEREATVAQIDASRRIVK